MANITANVQIANVIVSSTPTNVVITEGNTSIANLVTTTTTVNVSQTPYEVNVAPLATVANTAIRKAISVANISGYGNISYDNTISSNGVIRYEGITDPEIRKTISHLNLSGFGNVNYSNTTGVISFTGVSEAEIAEVITQNPANVRTALSANDTGGFGGFSYNVGTGVFTYVGPTQSDVRSSISVVDGSGDGSLSYDEGNGIITYVGPNQVEANARIAAAPLQVRAHLSADSNITYNSTTGVIGQALYTQDIQEGANLWYTNQRVINFLEDPSKDAVDIFAGGGAGGYGDIYAQDISAQKNVFATTFRANETGKIFVNWGGTWGVDRPVGPNQMFIYDNGDANITLMPAIAYKEREANGDPANVWMFTNKDNTYYPLPTNTDDLAEGGTNLYYTTNRANTAIVTYFGDAANGPFTINGNLEVQGNIDYVNVEDLLVNDQSITLNYGNASSRDAFIYVDRSGDSIPNVALKWNNTSNSWQFTNDGITYANINSLSASTTDDLAEGSTNLYFSNARALSAIVDGNVKLKQFSETVQDVGNVSGNVTFNLANGTIIESTLIGNVESISFSGLTAGSSASIIFTQDATGNHKILAPDVPIPTGGTVTTDGTYVYHTFESDGEFRTYSDINYTYLVVGGGGGGGTATSGSGGGGGAGGYVTGNSSVNDTSVSITIGAGGTPDNNGANSSLGNVVALGGGAGGASVGTGGDVGSNGGSGGGGGASTTVPVDGGLGTPGQGNDGGQAKTATSGGAPVAFANGGGGGAGSAGGDAASGYVAGDGGAGSTWINGVTYAGGGGGDAFGTGVTDGTGGTGGGGNAGSAGTANTGGGGGGGANGGSGVVIVAYLLSEISPATHTTNGNWLNWHFEDGDITVTPEPASKTLVEVMYDGAEYYSTFKQFEANTSIGDITGVTAGSGLTGGGTSGTVTLDVGAGYGITVNADSVEVTNADIQAQANVAFSNNTTDNLTEGSTNLYFTYDNANTWLATKTTDNLTEGTNLYFSNARVNAFIQDNITTSDINEGTNLYYTEARANSAIDARVNKAFVDALNVDADTLDGQDGTYYTNFNNQTNVPTAIGNAFVTVSVSGQSNVVADSNADVLTLVAGPNVTITTDAANDSITIDSTGGAGGTYSNADVQNFLENGYSAANIDANDIVAVTFTGDGSDLTDVRAQTVEEKVINKSGGLLPKGTPVYATGSVTADALWVNACDASNAATMPCIGVLATDLANDTEGRAIIAGKIAGVDTSSFSPGDEIYVAPGGGYANTHPAGEANIIQFLGIVTESSNTGGGIVNIESPHDESNLDNGNIFIGGADNRTTTIDLDAFTYEITSNANIKTTANMISDAFETTATYTTAAGYGSTTQLWSGGFVNVWFPAGGVGLSPPFDSDHLMFDGSISGVSLSNAEQVSFSDVIGPGNANINGATFFVGTIQGGFAYPLYLDSGLTTKANATTLGVVDGVTQEGNILHNYSAGVATTETWRIDSSTDNSQSLFLKANGTNRYEFTETGTFKPNIVEPTTSVNTDAIVSRTGGPIEIGSPTEETQFNGRVSLLTQTADRAKITMSEHQDGSGGPDITINKSRGNLTNTTGAVFSKDNIFNFLSSAGTGSSQENTGGFGFTADAQYPYLGSNPNGTIRFMNDIVWEGDWWYQNFGFTASSRLQTNTPMQLRDKQLRVDYDGTLYSGNSTTLHGVVNIGNGAENTTHDVGNAVLSIQRANNSANVNQVITFWDNASTGWGLPGTTDDDIVIGLDRDYFGDLPDGTQITFGGNVKANAGNISSTGFTGYVESIDTLDGTTGYGVFYGLKFYGVFTDASRTTFATYSQFGGTDPTSGGDFNLGGEVTWKPEPNAGATNITDRDYTFTLNESSEDLVLSTNGSNVATFESTGNVTFAGNIASVNGVTTDNMNTSFHSHVTLYSNEVWLGSGGNVPTQTAFNDALATNVPLTNMQLKQFKETVVALGSVSGDQSTALDAANGSIYSMTATGGITINSIANAAAGTSMTIIITQDGTGNHTLTSSMKFAGGTKTLSTGPGDIDIISVFFDGSTYYASLTTDYQ